MVESVAVYAQHNSQTEKRNNRFNSILGRKAFRIMKQPKIKDNKYLCPEDGRELFPTCDNVVGCWHCGYEIHEENINEKH